MLLIWRTSCTFEVSYAGEGCHLLLKLRLLARALSCAQLGLLIRCGTRKSKWDQRSLFWPDQFGVISVSSELLAFFVCVTYFESSRDDSTAGVISWYLFSLSNQRKCAILTLGSRMAHWSSRYRGSILTSGSECWFYHLVLRLLHPIVSLGRRAQWSLPQLTAQGCCAV